MSKLSTQPPKIILELSKLLKKNNFYFKNPWDNADENLSILTDNAGWIGLDLNEDDMEFMAAFMLENIGIINKLINNDNLKVSDAIFELTFPKLQKFKVWYEIWGPATLTEKYKTSWESYYKDWTRDSLRYSYNNGDFDYFSGEYQEYETDNFEADNFDIIEVRDIRETKTPLLDKLIVENTKDLLDSLDKETLYQLRDLINQRLSS